MGIQEYNTQAYLFIVHRDREQVFGAEGERHPSLGSVSGYFWRALEGHYVGRGGTADSGSSLGTGGGGGARRGWWPH